MRSNLEPESEGLKVRRTSCPRSLLVEPSAYLPTAQPDLVAIGIMVRDLAHAVRVGFPLDGVESPLGDLRDERVEVLDEEREPGVAGVFRLLHNVQVSMLRQLPDGLSVVGKEAGRRAQQPFVPRECRCAVGDRDAREQVELRGLHHASCCYLSHTQMCARPT